MVWVRDDGIFDAPVDKVWRYIQDEARHVHRSFKTTKVLEQMGNVLVLEADVLNPDGKSRHEETWKFTFDPPKGFDFEFLSGPLKGSKFSQIYTALGNRTKADVVGDFYIQGLDEDATRKAVLATLEEEFNEDTAALRTYK